MIYARGALFYYTKRFGLSDPGRVRGQISVLVGDVLEIVAYGLSVRPAAVGISGRAVVEGFPVKGYAYVVFSPQRESIGQTFHQLGPGALAVIGI